MTYFGSSDVAYSCLLIVETSGLSYIKSSFPTRFL